MGHVSVVVESNIIIQGGFNFMSEEGEKIVNILKRSNDLRILDTMNFTWSRLRVSGAPPIPCYFHSTDISDAEIIMFGGYGAFKPQYY